MSKFRSNEVSDVIYTPKKGTSGFAIFAILLLIAVVLILVVSISSMLNTSDEPTERATETSQTQSNQSQGGNQTMTLTRINKTDSSTTKVAVVELENGAKFTLTLYPEIAPETVENFITKSQSGHYNGLSFHRVEDWVTQGGDPSGNGTGGGDMAAEYNDRTFKVGSVGIARGADPNINNDSQFFVTTKDSSFLDKNYTNFGDVTSGMETVTAIKIGDKIKSITVE